ncbi:MFS transporter [Dyella solisilvae]|uniref:Multidrug efflux pump Tap n=1 Tax=Dyella solisilvae TaxID=1920168 RepID=A0A370KB54_9GAMM|nr:MFS transporter [Dyella solisilvae]RDI99892.1 MFS transporter [Dyella solisilvae]
MSASPSVISDASPAAIEHPLRNRIYRRWLGGSAISLLGDQFYLVALPWLVLQHLGSAGALGAVLMAGGVPRALLMLFGGALADHISARRIMLMTAAARAVCVAVIGILAWRGALSAWTIYALVIAFGVADAFALPAQSAYVPSLLKREQLVAATSLAQIVAQLAAILAPLPAGLLIAGLGVAPALFVDAASFLFVIAALLFLPDPPLTARHASALKSIGMGIAYVMRDVPLRTLMLLATILNFCIAGPMAVGVAYLAKTRLDSSSAYGVMVAALAAGGLIGALVASAWKIRRRGVLIVAGSALLGFCLMAIPWAGGVASVAGVLLLMGATASLVNVHIGAWMMQRIDVEVRGRVSSVLMLASFGTAPLSMAVAGFLIAWNENLSFLLAGAAILLTAVVALLKPSVRDIRE